MRLSANHTLQRQPKLSYVLFRLQRWASDLQGAGVDACLCKSIKKQNKNHRPYIGHPSVQPLVRLLPLMAWLAIRHKWVCHQEQLRQQAFVEVVI